jgi:hypothetical protein
MSKTQKVIINGTINPTDKKRRVVTDKMRQNLANMRERKKQLAEERKAAEEKKVSWKHSLIDSTLGLGYIALSRILQYGALIAIPYLVSQYNKYKNQKNVPVKNSIPPVIDKPIENNKEVIEEPFRNFAASARVPSSTREEPKKPIIKQNPLDEIFYDVPYLQ